jgi:hypothetical protein
MRFFYGFIAAALWACFLGELGIDIPIEIVVLTLAIVTAGAMAGWK